MAKEVLIQKYLYTVPATTGTQIYTYNFKSDELFNFLAGIACPLATALPTFDDIKIELRDDYRSILSFSPVANWCKATSAQDYDLTQVFRPIKAESKGKNFYLNVKATNTSAPFSFVALFKQTNAAPEIKIFNCPVDDYDMQSFTIAAPALGANYNINLPSDFNNVAGINIVGGDQASFYNLLLDINDSINQLLDPVPLSILKVTETQSTDKGFYPVAFASNNKQVNIRLTPLDSTVTYTPTDITITFLLTR